MTTTVTDTIGSSGAAYATIALWEDGTDNTSLVAADEIRVGALKNETFSNGGATVATIAGATTDATRYRHLTTDTGASFRDNASVQSNALRYNASNGAAISGADYLSRSIVCTENFARFSNLQISAGVGRAGAIEASGTGGIIENCILEGGYENGIVIPGAGTIVRNCVLVMRRASANMIASCNNSSNSWYNNTLVCPSDVTPVPSAGFGGSYGTIAVQNCAIFGVTAVKAGGSTFNFTTCMTDVASPPSGCTTVAYSAASGAKFENISDGTHDYRIKTGSSLIDAGTTDSTNAANDIARTARPSGAGYDVGAWEFVAAGGGGGGLPAGVESAYFPGGMQPQTWPLTISKW